MVIDFIYLILFVDKTRGSIDYRPFFKVSTSSGFKRALYDTGAAISVWCKSKEMLQE